ncbi:MAG: site-specific integrase [candidate division WOR-3 bacterium]
MPALKRFRTRYPGVFYIEGTCPATGKPERIYYIRYRKEGQLIEEKAGRQFQDDMSPARASMIRAERMGGKAPTRREMREAAAKIRWTVDRLWQEYTADKPDTKSWRTDRYRYEKFLKAGFGGKEPKDIGQLDLHRLRLNLSKTLKAQTVKHVLRLLTRIINFGVKKGLCPGLAFKVEYPQVNNLKTEDLTSDQLSALMEALKNAPDLEAANFMALALSTGMRRGELFRLKWDDIDFERGFIHLRDPKGGTDQKIPLNQAAREVLANHPRTGSPFVFPGRGGQQRTRPPKGIEAIRKAAGLPKDFRPLHGLRHTYASMLASSGQVDLYTLQKLLTHKSPAMTQRYAHLRDEALRRAAEVAGALIGQALNGGGKKTAVSKGND